MYEIDGQRNVRVLQ